MRSSTTSIAFLLLALFSSAAAAAQAHARDPKEYGIGVVEYASMYRYQTEDVIRSRPSTRGDTVATLNSDQLCFGTTGGCVRSYGRMIEFGYEVPGWAVLGFNRDSTWAQVTLDPEKLDGPTGWVDLRSDSVKVLLWSEVLPRKNIFFLTREAIGFYRTPGGQRVHRADERSHSMKGIRARGPWLQVELATPGEGCGSGPATARDTVWIRYLTSTGRPNVYYPTRGC